MRDEATVLDEVPGVVQKKQQLPSFLFPSPSWTAQPCRRQNDDCDFDMLFVLLGVNFEHTPHDGRYSVVTYIRKR